MIPIPYKIIFTLTAFIVFMCGSLIFGQHRYNQGVAVTTDRYEAALASEKAAASKKLAEVTEQARQAEQALNDFKNQQELKDAQALKTVSDLSDRLRHLAVAGRLRDPNAAGCGGGSGSPAGQATTASSSGAADGAEAGGLLSEELSGLLQRLVNEADTINAAYASCRPTVME